MTSLRTLKDLKKFMWNDNEYENMDITDEEYSAGKKATILREDAITISELKAEAIKWVKDINSKMPKEINFESHIVTWIKHFFNLTEEEIK